MLIMKICVYSVGKLCVESGKIGDFLVENQNWFNRLFIFYFLKIVEMIFLNLKSFADTESFIQHNFQHSVENPVESLFQAF